jgi:hypothetical protein
VQLIGRTWSFHLGFSYLILTLWTLAGWLTTWRVLGRRG